MKIVQYTAPTIEPVTVEEMLLHLRVDDIPPLLTEEMIAAIATGRGTVETITRRQLLTATWDYYLNSFPSGSSVDLPFGNLQSVTHVKYTDSDGTQTTMVVDTEYIVETNGQNLGRIVLPYGETWPSFTAYTSNPIVIRFVCGWTSASLVPDDLKLATKFAAEDIYYHGDRHEILDRVIQSLTASYRLWDEF